MEDLTIVLRPDGAMLDGPKVPRRGHYDASSRAARQDWAEELSGTSLRSLGDTDIDPSSLTGNLENFVGAVSVPVGLAGPLWFSGSHVDGWIVAPMATTEGALVASSTRGATAMNRSGGVRTRALGQRMLRVPLFGFRSVEEAFLFTGWVADRRASLQTRSAEVSAHARLEDIQPVQVGRYVHVKFVYATADAAGQNMTTACTWHACRWLLEELSHSGLTVELFALDGNLSGDKKVTLLNFTEGRGTRVTAEAILTHDALTDVLKVDTERLLTVSRAVSTGGVQAGSVGSALNTSNMVAALFCATGQDLACIHESSVALFHVEPHEDGIYASVTFPSLVVGTVGGGTHLPRQGEALALMGCEGYSSSDRLAEILAGFALGLELSLLAAVATDHWATAHERLGRNRPVSFLRRDELLDPRFLNEFTERSGVLSARISAVRPLAVEMGDAILTDLGARIGGRKFVGLAPLTLTLATAEAEEVDVVAKAKALDREVLLAGASMASLLGDDVVELWREYDELLGFNDLHRREPALAALDEPALEAVRPTTIAIHEDVDREIHLIVMEHLHPDTLRTGLEPSTWSRTNLRLAIEGIGGVHRRFLDAHDELSGKEWFGPLITPEQHGDVAALHDLILTRTVESHPDWFPAETIAAWRSVIARIEDTRTALAEMPQTLIHHDFNPRNVAIRDTGDGPRLVAWDWELATIDVPQRDVAELLAFTLQPDVDPHLVEVLVEHHRHTVTGGSVPADRWQAGFRLALESFAATRLVQYTMAQGWRESTFLSRVVATTFHLLGMDGDPVSGSEGVMAS